MKGIVNNTPIGRYWVALIYKILQKQTMVLHIPSFNFEHNCWEAKFQFHKDIHLFTCILCEGRREKLMTWVVLFPSLSKDTFAVTQKKTQHKKTSKKWLEWQESATTLQRQYVRDRKQKKVLFWCSSGCHHHRHSRRRCFLPLFQDNTHSPDR